MIKRQLLPTVAGWSWGKQWVGTCNEMNASYAADGYARLKGMGRLP
jgi:TPP-dependent 2-oxoacid decarboxylase